VLLAITIVLRDDLSVKQVRETAQELREQIELSQPVISHVFFRLAPS
jgi:hypothetical protein